MPKVLVATMEFSRLSFFLNASRFSFILINTILILRCSAASLPLSPATTDASSLLYFKSTISDDPTQTLASWNSSIGFCRWPGVTCGRQHANKVTAIDLSSLGLAGPISPALANLTFLQRLNLAANRLQGLIPPELGGLRRLKYLNLSMNSLEGEIPVSLFRCSSIQTISLTSNELVGEVPSNISQCKKLQILLLNNNKLTGGIPDELGSLPGLLYINLSNNNLTGGIPASLGNASSLAALYLSHNGLSGSIPSSLGKLPLAFVFLDNNKLAGSIPSSFQNLTSLLYLDLSYNNLVGKIPASLGNLTSLNMLDFTSNNLSGIIPPSLGQLSSLSVLALTQNGLSGGIPPSLGSLSSVTTLALSHNKLSGEIPPPIYNMSTLNYLGVAGNLLRGTISPDVGNTLPGLKKLYMYFNQLQGPIPMSLANASGLEDIELTGNKLTGVIPSNIGTLQNLYWLSLDRNQLEASTAEDWSFLTSLTNCSGLQVLQLNRNRLGGVLPSSIGNLSSMLQWLVLGENQISGSLPVAIGTYKNLTFLDLKQNHLSGNIPATIGNLQGLEVLDLDTNNFSGTIPTSIGNLTGLSELYLGGNALEGSIPASLGNLQTLRHLDLSYNNLTGTVPREIATIASLSKFLGFSHNSLTGSLPSEINRLKNLVEFDASENNFSGKIPSSIGECQLLERLYLQGNLFQGSIPSFMSNLKGIEELDLSRNNLTGHIPDFLVSFKFLYYLNLSFNEFDGEVPSQGVFVNLSAVSVQGNSNLCGGNKKLQLPPCSAQSHRRSHWSVKLKVIISVSVAFLCLILLSLLGIHLWIQKSKRKSLSTAPIEEQHMKVTYSQLVKATDGFSSANLIGVGSYGSVYKGVMDHGGEKVIAVKVLNLQQRGASKSFLAECEALRNIRHRNLIKILTSCSSVDYKGNNFKALVFEFMPNGSLEHWLHPEANVQNQERHLNLLKRLNIAIDVASAVDYLHHHGPMQIVHCDLKPSNVLLDNDMTAHVGDFGLARFLTEPIVKSSKDSSRSIGMKGTIGYVAPEYGVGNEVSALGDVYSYGILLLEMFTGRRPTEETFKEGLSLHSFVEQAFPERIIDIVDPRLLHEDDEDHNGICPETSRAKKTTVDCIVSVLRIGLICTDESPRERMQIGEVVNQLHAIRNAVSRSRGQSEGKHYLDI